MSFQNNPNVSVSGMRRTTVFGGWGEFHANKLAAALLALALALGLLAPLAAPVSAGSPAGYTWTEYSSNPVFSGTSRAYYPSVIDVGATYHMWYTDYQSGHYQVAHTTSADGMAWATPAYVSGLTGHPAHSVVVNIGTDASPHYRIWYADEAAPWPYDPSCFRTAESYDSQGETWTNDQVIGQVAGYELLTGDSANHPWQYGSYGPGAVLYNPSGYATVSLSDPMGNKYAMYYDQLVYVSGLQEVTQLAVSADGITWTRWDGANYVIRGSQAWDAVYAYVWSVIKDSGGYHAWFSGGVSSSSEGIGYASSTDGLNWSEDLQPIFSIYDAGVPSWRSSRTYTPCVLQEDGIYKMWFTGVGPSGYRVGFAAALKPGGNPTDPAGALKSSYYQREDVWCSGSGFFPNSYVDVYIVDYVDTWTEDMSIPTPRYGGTPLTVQVDPDGSLPLTKIWTARLKIGHYDVFFDANQDGKYQSAVDVDPPFWVYGDPAPVPAFPGICMGIAAALGAGVVACLVRAAITRKASPHS